jgi:FMN phosphatase YigB (HAD superfamily)
VHGRRLQLGVASNCQPYTVREFEGALAATGLPFNLFRAALTFRSYEHGFSKPDPHVFRLLTARLAALGIAPGETLMVGDRVDNDILPARAQGFLTWHLVEQAAQASGGSWADLRDFFRSQART